MRTKDVVVGFILLVILVAGFLIIKNLKSKKQANLPSPTPSIEQRIKETFGAVTFSDDTDKIELKDVKGGAFFGVATKTEVLANLPELSVGKYYQAVLENDQGKFVVLGRLRIAKGGYLLEYDLSKYPNFNKLKILLDDKTLLEGSF